MTDEELIARLRELDPVLEVEFDTHRGVVQNPCGAAQAIEKALYLLRDQADRIEQLNEKIKKLDKLVYNSYCGGFVEAWDCPCISSGYTFTWESSETYKTLKEITGNTDDQ
jgi:hypothetical protein